MLLDNKNFETFDSSKLRLAKSGRTIKILYEKEPLQICTSTLYSPFGVKSVSKEWLNFNEYNIDCCINLSNSESSNVFKEFIEKFDKKLEELFLQNLTMFPNSDKMDLTNVTYSPFYKENGNYPKLFKLQFSRDKNGNFESFVFNHAKDKIKICEDNIETYLKRGTPFKCIIECSKVWLYNGKIGSIWNINQLKISEKKFTQNSTTSQNDELINKNSEEDEKDSQIRISKGIYEKLMIIE